MEGIIRTYSSVSLQSSFRVSSCHEMLLSADLLPVLCVKTPEIRDISLDVCEIVNDIRAVCRGVEGKFSHKVFSLVNVISANETGEIRLEEDFRIVPLQLDFCCVHPVEGEVEISRYERADLGARSGFCPYCLQSQGFSLFTAVDLADESRIDLHFL